MREIYLQNSEGFVIVYNITSGTSFKEVDDVLESIKRAKGDGQPIMLVGNKCDLEDKREVETAVGESKAQSYGAHFMEVSAKENVNIEKVFFFA